MKRSMIVLAAVAFMVSSLAVLAEEAKELTLKGKLAKAEKEGKVTYTLATAQGDVVLPAPKAEKEGEKVIVLDQFVGAEVEVKALGSEEVKDGKKVVTVKKVVDVKKVDVKKVEVKK